MTFKVIFEFFFQLPYLFDSKLLDPPKRPLQQIALRSNFNLMLQIICTICTLLDQPTRLCGGRLVDIFIPQAYELTNVLGQISSCRLVRTILERKKKQKGAYAPFLKLTYTVYIYNYTSGFLLTGFC